MDIRLGLGFRPRLRIECRLKLRARVRLAFRTESLELLGWSPPQRWLEGGRLWGLLRKMEGQSCGEVQG